MDSRGGDETLKDMNNTDEMIQSPMRVDGNKSSRRRDRWYVQIFPSLCAPHCPGRKDALFYAESNIHLC